MCRIAGIINPDLDINQASLFVKEMCALQKHGGPDDEGVYINNTLSTVLGHRRLSIIDLSNNAHQPMSYLSQRYQITFNGEIYNYQELKSELLSAGCTFTTNSDTEVILAAFSKWGVQSFGKFMGMYAFGLLDTYTNDFYLVRDTEGIKPLYYSSTSNGIAFASEVRAFSCIPYLAEENPDWRIYLMAYGHLPEPITTKKNVFSLPKGNYIKYSITNKSSELIQYYKEEYSDQITNRLEAIDAIKQELDKAVERHLIADAPIGVFLSGGLDSSIIALLANKNNQQLLNTISIYFEDAYYSEKKYQDLLLTKLTCNSHQHLVTEQKFHQHLPSIIDGMDLPSCDGINTWFISEYAKENGLKAVLSGIGSDELLGGYPSFNRMKYAQIVSSLPKKLLRSGKFFGESKYRRIQYLSIPGIVGKYLFLRGQYIPSEIAEYLNMDETEVWEKLEQIPVLPAVSDLSSKNQASWMESNLYMQNQLLRDADVMSMAHGVEIRVPFLDKNFVELTKKISSPIKFSGGLPKQLLIDTYKDVLPELIWNRPKMGFTFPFAEWLKNDEYAMDVSNDKFDINRKRFLQGHMHWSQFFTTMLLEKNG